MFSQLQRQGNYQTVPFPHFPEDAKELSCQLRALTLLLIHLSWLAKNGAWQYEARSVEGTTGTAGGVFLHTKLSSSFLLWAVGAQQLLRTVLRTASSTSPRNTSHRHILSSGPHLSSRVVETGMARGSIISQPGGGAALLHLLFLSLISV